jgi:hypothetical protein
MNYLRTFTFILIGLTALCGCGDTFQPRNSLQEVRVLTIEAIPLEVGLDETVTVKPVVHLPEGRSIASYRWHYCPINAGAVAGYRCANPACDVDIESAAYDAEITVAPSDALFACIGELLNASAASGGDGGNEMNSDDITRLDTALFYELTDDEGRVFRHFKAIPLWKEKPSEINRAPVILDVAIDDVSVWDGVEATAIREVEIAVRVTMDPESVDSFTDTRGEVVDEDIIVSFFATSGTFEADRKDGLDVTNTLTFSAGEMEEEPWEPPLALASDVTSLDIYVVARDGRGGQTAVGPYTVNLSAGP